MQTVDKLLKKLEDQKKKEELTKEEITELRKACRDLFSTRTGINVAKFMMRLSHIYDINKNTSNLIELGKDIGKAEMYLLLIKSNLSSEQLSKIEGGNQDG